MESLTTCLTRKGNYGRYRLGPIDAGYARSLASALRRVLLSSMEGAAITSVLIQGVQHEFQDILHVKEDVTDIVQNLKKVRLRSFLDRPVTASLDVQGECEVFARDIKAPGVIEIVNPGLHIATLDNEQAHLVMELLVETGRGFVSAEVQAEQKVEQQPLGVILVDAIYSPIVHVSITIEKIQRGRLENLDNIILGITTDGTISPSEALCQSAALLRQQFDVFAGCYERTEDEDKKPQEVSDILIPQYIYNTDIVDLGLSVRIQSMLKRNNISKVGQILEMNGENLKAMRNCGEKSLQEIGASLHHNRFLPNEMRIR